MFNIHSGWCTVEYTCSWQNYYRTTHAINISDERQGQRQYNIVNQDSINTKINISLKIIVYYANFVAKLY